MNMLRNISLALALALSGTALAHDDATLDAMASPHGGQLRMSGPYHFELVVGENEVKVYVTDHAMQSISVAGATGNAIILSGGKSELPLAPAGENLVEGKGEFKSGPDMKVVVSLTIPGQSQAWQARFTPWAKMHPESAPDAPTTQAPMPMPMEPGMQMDHSQHMQH